MAVPSFERFLLPSLQVLRDGRTVHTRKELAQSVADRLGLSEEERAETIPKAGSRRFENRTYWAKVYLKAAGLVETPARGMTRITPVGVALLATNPTSLRWSDLMAYESFRDFRKRSQTRTRPEGKGDQASVGEPAASEDVPSIEEPTSTPEERMEAAHHEARSALASELLDRLLRVSPAFFERLVVDLMLKMGYGGPAGGGERLGGSGDGGVDGVIHEDKLGLDLIYLQAKRWTSPVGAAIVREFTGSLVAHAATKGVLITTSRFTADAEQYVRRIPQRIALVDGYRLAELMIDHDFGVAVQETYLLKRIDSDFFPDDDL